ncbi:hypothetical protein [Duganella callida]|uniref:TIR domain-containing protein n=1 Tax=Duganella callida TaxID=2561932 RepID=A0A4Y9S7G9_9BURK|nr:hypothetical protein [Duganella callida]TFW17556.1 hypothetical protein E4L98_20340 [Duganella callida]
MATCFVMQPFDGGQYDKRFKDVYAPAITAAGYEPYRVDQDPKVSVPIDSIETGIRNAVVCLADISEDNPNVWYELGFALATGKPVVMVCKEGRPKFPFDIQHRTIITYKTESTSDFDKLRDDIAAKITAFVEKDEMLEAMSEKDEVSPVAGLSPAELRVVAILAGSQNIDGYVAVFSAKSDAERAGVTDVGFNLGLRKLAAKKLVEYGTISDYNGNEYSGIALSEKGWQWIEDNETMFVLHRQPPRPKNGDLDDSIPF